MKKLYALLVLLTVGLLGPTQILAAGTACGGNLVWIDTNGDGVKSGAESGLPGAVVTLRDYYGDQLDQQVAGNGYFKLCTGSAGLYQIVVDIPDGYSISPQWQGNSQYHDSDASPEGVIDVELKAGRNIGKYDIGLVPSSTAQPQTAVTPVTTTTVETETTTPVVQQRTTPRGGVLFGPWVEVRHRNDGVFGTFNTALMAATTGTILDILNDAETTGTKTILQLGSAGEWGWNFSNNTSTFTMQKWKRSVDRFADNPAIFNAIKRSISNGQIRAFHLIDEPHHRRWSPSNQYNHITNADLDEMARYIKSYWPNAITAVRASPRTLTFYGRQAHNWKHLDEAFLMVNYRKWANQGARTLEAFMEREIAEANRQGLGLIGSVQMLIGAPTSDGRFWPDRGRNGASPVGKLKVSPLELRTYVDAFLERRNAAGKIDAQGTVQFDTIMVFRWDRNNERDWQDPHYSSVMSELISELQNR